jgi:glycosidase
VADGYEFLDPNNPDSASNGMGGWNSIIDIPRPDPKALPLLTSRSHQDDHIQLTLANPAQKVIAFWENTRILEESIVTSSVEVSIALHQAMAGKERSRVRVWAYNEEGLSSELMIPLHKGKVLSEPSMIRRQDYHAMIMYFLMVDRFHNADPKNDKPLNIPEVHPRADFYGGDLAGVIEKLKDGYFDWLGTNTIWVSPITQNPEGPYGLYPEPKTQFSSYHGYWPISNTKVDYRFGSAEVFRQLVEEAHAKGHNVLLDYVANHVHEEHPVYQKNKDWATPLYLPDGTENTQKWDEHRLTTWFDTFLPTLDLTRPDVVEPMTDSAAYWIEEFKIDGFRHDATKHIPLIFWRTLTRKLKEKKGEGPVPFQIGETYGSRALINSYINTGMLDSQFDFNLYDAAVGAFANPEFSFKSLIQSLEESLAYYGSHHLMGNITGNQDRARFISYADGSIRFDEDAKHAGWNREITMQDTTAYRKLSALTAFNMVIPGIPCIYYGDEYGSVGGNDPDNRKPMKFEKLTAHEIATRDRARKLIHLRKDNLALIYGTTEILAVEDQWMMLKRKYFENEVVAIFNKSDESITVSPGIKGQLHFYGQWKDEEVELPPQSFAIITTNIASHE